VLSQSNRVLLRALIVAAGGLLLAALLSQTTLYPRLASWLEDALQRRLAASLPMERVVVVDIDEASMERLAPRLGAWPYARDVYAKVQRFLAASGARAVAYDILFAEVRDGDGAFAAALDARTVLAAAALPYPYARPAEYLAHLGDVALADAQAAPQTAALARAWPDLTLPLSQLTRVSQARVGVISTVADEDGVVRRLAPFHLAYGKVLPGFVVATLLAGDAGHSLSLEDGRLRVGEHAWPLASDGSIAPRLPANTADLTVVPFHQLLAAADGTVGGAHIGDIVRDRIVFVGSSSAVLGDFALTPAGRLPGLYVNALIAESLEAGQVLSPPRLWLDFALALLAIALPAGLTARGTALRPRDLLIGLAAGVVLLAGAGIGTAAASQQSHWLFAAAAGVAAFALALLAWLLALYQEKQRLYYEKTAALEANRLKSEFLNHMTHELRTPITAIMGFNKFNLYGDDIGREQRLRHSAIIARNCEHLLALVNNNLDLARMEAGQLKVERAAHEARALLDDVVATLRMLAHEKGLALELQVAEGLPRVLSLDAFRVRQVLINLLGNAIKFTAQGKVTLAARWEAGELRCEVRDTGPGIPADSLERIFQPFQRAPGVAAVGTGLGLSITRKLAELMGGSITARSEPGKGSVFELRVPATEATMPVTAPAPVPAGAPAPKPEKLSGRVLLADDNADLRDMVQIQLGELGLASKAVGDGIEAIDAALAEPYNVVLLDMDMPFMDGYETVRVLRERGYTGTVVGFTAHQAGSPLERALIEGCDDVVSKPVSLERLREVLAPYADGAVKPRASGAEAIPVLVDGRLRSLVARFLLNCGRDLARLRTALAGGDLSVTRTIGHSLGGVGGSYGFEEITRIGRAIEERSIRGDAASVGNLAAQLEDYLARVQPEYR
jgi:signal transduction histidine kinase/HPt (histidine-containing phosphotransfer) domain-containing protein/ActR/RegA family two-component response regulator